MRRTLAAALLLLPVLLAPAHRLMAGVNVWTPIGPDGGWVPVLAADPNRPQVLYAGAEGVFKSSDGGATWRRTSRGLKGIHVTALAVAPADSAVVYAGHHGGVFRSLDGGATWSPLLRTPLLYVTSLAADPRDAGTVWVGTSNGLYWTRDGGTTWQGDGSALVARVLDVEVDPFAPNTVYAVVASMEDYGEDAIIRSTDGGATWRLSNQGVVSLPYQDYAQLAADPSTPGVVYASYYNPYEARQTITYRSSDHGTTWSQSAGGYPLAVDHRGTVYAGDRRSDDHGVTWEPAAVPSATAGMALHYAAGAGADGTLWAGTERLGVLRSRDRAATWQPASRGLHTTSALSFVIHPRSPRVIHAATASGLMQTLSAGARWRQAENGLPGNGLAPRGWQTLALDPRHPETLYLAWSRTIGAGSAPGLARSDNGGAHWEVLWSPEEGCCFFPNSLVVDPFDSDVLYLTGGDLSPDGGGCYVARSDDRGATRACLPPFASPNSRADSRARLFTDPHRPGRVWVPVQPDLFWRSDDRGDHWTAVRPRGLEKAGMPRWLLIDPARPGRLYLGTERWGADNRPERVWRSDDDGLTWRPWGKGMPLPSRVNQLLTDPREPGVFYAVVEHFHDILSPQQDQSGVYWSRNGGRTFHPLVNGLPGAVLQLAIDPRNPRQLYAATLRNGIYTFTRQ